MATLFTRWQDVVFTLQGGAELPLRLRAALPGEAREILRRVREWIRAMVENGPKVQAYFKDAAAPALPEDRFALFERVFGDEWSRGTFIRNVKPPAGGLDSDEGALADGGAIYDAMGEGERIMVLQKLADLAILGGHEGKASSSSSTSSPKTESTPDASASAATSTASADGTAP